MAWCFDYLGVSGQGGSRPEAIHDARVAACWVCDWLAKGGENRDPPSADVEIVETVLAQGDELGDSEGFFFIDAQPYDSKEAASWLDLTDRAVRDAVKIADVDREHDRWVLQHLAQAVWWYGSRIPGSPANTGDMPRDDDLKTQVLTVHREFRNVHLPFYASLDDPDAVYTTDGERWSARKTCRRALWHSLYHLRQFDQR